MEKVNKTQKSKGESDMKSGRFVAVCRYCGKRGTIISATIQGVFPALQPIVNGSCPSHPSGKKNMPHSPKWTNG